MQLFVIFILIISSPFIHTRTNSNWKITRIRRNVSAMNAQISKMKTCDQSTIPVMESFNMSQFSGQWYELGKSASSYIDVNDGLWNISEIKDNSYNFLFSGRNGDKNYCISPITGIIKPSTTTPGELELHYKTFTTEVSENIRVLFTDYDSVAVIYSCTHIMEHTGGCHPAAVIGGLWTRKTHVGVKTYNDALKYLEKACIDQQNIIIRNVVGPCEIDNLDFENGENLVHDICYQPLDVGSCAVNVKRYYYDKVNKECTEFIFGGCNGNRNNFLSFHECEHQCLRKGEEVRIFPECHNKSKCALHCPPCCRHMENGCVKCDCQNISLSDLECPYKSNCAPDCQEEIFPSCYKCTCQNNDISQESEQHNEVVKTVISQNNGGTRNKNSLATVINLLLLLVFNYKIKYVFV